jgi:hypothetical protein
MLWFGREHGVGLVAEGEEVVECGFGVAVQVVRVELVVFDLGFDQGK